MSEQSMTALSARQRVAFAEISDRLPGLMYERYRLQASAIEPSGVLLPARLNVPNDGPDATDRGATCMGLPVTWSDTEQWGLIVALPEARA